MLDGENHLGPSTQGGGMVCTWATAFAGGSSNESNAWSSSPRQFLRVSHLKLERYSLSKKAAMRISGPSS